MIEISKTKSTLKIFRIEIIELVIQLLTFSVMRNQTQNKNNNNNNKHSSTYSYYVLY